MERIRAVVDVSPTEDDVKDAKTIIDNLEEFIWVPSGVERVKNTLLTLAVSGKLVLQDPSEASVEDLFSGIQKGSDKKLGAGGRNKKVVVQPPVSSEEIPFEIPKSWRWARLDDVAEYMQRGKSPEYVDSSAYPVISQKCVRWGGMDWDPIRFIAPSSIESYAEERFLKQGDILVNSTGTGTIGRACQFIPSTSYNRVVADGHVTVIRTSQMYPAFVVYWLQTPFVQSALEGGKAAGSTNQIEWNLSTLKNEPVPIPPLDEQKRIAAKLDDVMDLIGSLRKLVSNQ